VPRRLCVRLFTACVAVSLTAAITVSPAAGTPGRGSERDSDGRNADIAVSAATAAPRPSPVAEARRTLSQAKAVLSRSRTPQARATGSLAAGPEPDATLVLTDLRQRLGDLPVADRPVARAILARPTFGKRPAGTWEHSYAVPEEEPVCARVCVHYVVSTVPGRPNDAVSTRDANGNGVPDYVQRVAATLSHVWTREVDDLGFRPPRSDLGVSDNGGGPELDVYLQDLPAGVYGYCAPDTAARITSAYCVLDNNYSASEYPEQTPTRNLQVTAAHEFFHAVQFAYDSYEDLWLMEGTAVWMEDEVYDDVNDGVQYLAQSPLSHPFVPLDYSDDFYGPYGVWVFWKFLSEWAGPRAADDPQVVRQVWNASVGPRFSTAALQSVLRARGTSFARVFGAFGTWANRPARYFSEGTAYPRAPLDRRFTLTRARPGSGLRSLRMSHMTHRYIRFTPGRTLTRSWRLRISVDLADTSRGSVARVVVHRRNGPSTVHPMRLSRSGNGSRVFDFRRAVVSNVELHVANASVRFRCGLNTSMSCGGYGYDDNLPSRYRATAVR
jgi:hypothetical protein